MRNLLDLCERHPTIKRLVIRSASAVYQVQRDLPVLIGEDHPLNMAGQAPQWVRDRIEADLSACVRMGMSPLEIVVCAWPRSAPGTGSQVYDYLQSPVCFQPAGFDPMINLMTSRDAVAALTSAIRSTEQGVFNIPGADTLPLRWPFSAGAAELPAIDSVLTPVPAAPTPHWTRLSLRDESSMVHLLRRTRRSSRPRGPRLRPLAQHRVAVPESSPSEWRTAGSR